MRILTQLVWLSGLAMEALILVRAIRCKAFAKYSLFYTYIASVLVTDASQYVISLVNYPLYKRLYWPALFITLSLGYGVIIEISRHAFAEHVSLDRFARWITMATYGTIFSLVAVHALVLPHWNLAANTADLERDLRIAEAVALITIVALAAYYGIELGKNIKGMILGFGVYVGISVLILALRLFLGAGFSSVWKIVQSSAYLAALVVWAVALWYYQPVAASRPAANSMDDYQMLAGQTRKALGSINQQLNRTVPR